jgi:hypothetical protein
MNHHWIPSIKAKNSVMNATAGADDLEEDRSK